MSNFHSRKSGNITRRGQALAEHLSKTGGWRARQAILGPVDEAIESLDAADKFRVKQDWDMAMSHIDYAAGRLKEARRIINQELKKVTP